VDGLRRQPSLPQLKREWPPEASDTHAARMLCLFSSNIGLYGLIGIDFVADGEDEFGSKILHLRNVASRH